MIKIETIQYCYEESNIVLYFVYPTISFLQANSRININHFARNSAIADTGSLRQSSIKKMGIRYRGASTFF